MENTEDNREKISRLKSEMIWKIWKKNKLKCAMK
jgi:hypothetical protein